MEQQINPFVRNFKLAVLKINKTYTLVSNNGKDSIDPSAVKDGFKIPMPYLMERVEKTSLFHNRDTNYVLFNKLKSIGRDLLLYIMVSLSKDKDYIHINPKDVCEEMDISRTTLYVGIGQLIEFGMIEKKDVKHYWINPIYLFNGDRVDYFKKLGEDYYEIVFTVPA